MFTVFLMCDGDGEDAFGSAFFERAFCRSDRGSGGDDIVDQNKCLSLERASVSDTKDGFDVFLAFCSFAHGRLLQVFSFFIKDIRFDGEYQPVAFCGVRDRLCNDMRVVVAADRIGLRSCRDGDQYDLLGTIFSITGELFKEFAIERGAKKFSQCFFLMVLKCPYRFFY